MHALSRIIKTGGEYDELWSADGKLSIEYRNQKDFSVYLSDGEWQCDECCDEDILFYLRCAAEIYAAIEKCRGFGYPLSLLNEFLPEDKSKLIPAELLRILMDDCSMGIYDACCVVVKCFGAQLNNLSAFSLSDEIQPRTAELKNVLSDSLKSLGFAFHDAYSLNCRCPFGAVEYGTEINLCIYDFGGINEAYVEIYSDYVNFELPMTKSGTKFFCAYTPTESSALWYRFRLVTEEGTKWLCPDESGHFSVLSDKACEGFRLTVYEKGFETPDWFKRAVMYQIFPDRFGFSPDNTAKNGISYHKSLGQTPELHKNISEPVRFKAREFEHDYSPDDFYGGTLKGIEKKLPYLKQLGISVIYLNPIFEARSNHRYDTSDYTKIDPILGCNSDYVNLCSKAAELGIRIILDGVFSHTGADSIYFNRYASYDSIGAYQGDNSQFYPWYDFKSFPDDYRCWWNFKDLPEVDETNPAWQDYIITGKDSIIRKWLKNGASGWRLDVADELPDEVLSLIRTAAKEEKPDSVIIGEVWEDAVTKVSYGKIRNYALGKSLDSVMNYPFREAVISFALGKTDAFSLRNFLLSQKANYPAPFYFSLMNLLGSHDVERLHTSLAFDFDVKALSREEQYNLKITPEQKVRADKLQKLCAAIQYCVPGVPCLYYGDEECLDGGRDPFNRAPFEPSRSGLHNFYAKLGQIRNDHLELILGDMNIRAFSPDILSIERIYNSSKIICIINRSDEELKLSYTDSICLLYENSPDTVLPLSVGIYKFT